ncbi:unnamed protein product [Caretta caretta]
MPLYTFNTKFSTNTLLEVNGTICNMVLIHNDYLAAARVPPEPPAARSRSFLKEALASHHCSFFSMFKGLFLQCVYTHF